MPSTRQHNNQDSEDISKQRASKACNRCRAKKARCSGGYPCSKCKASDGVCIFGYPKKSKRKTFPEHYVRALEMQQFKLVAGLQTMYTMLLAANSWPGPRLTENNGNPLAHDILDRLGLLEHEKTIISDMELGYSSDHQSNSDKASTINSSHRSWHVMEQSPKSGLVDSASPPRTSLRQYVDPQANDLILDTWRPQTTQSQSFPTPSIPEQQPTAFHSEPYSSTTTSFPSTLNTAQSVEGINWSAVDYPAAWWYDNFQIIQETSHLNNGPIPVEFTSNTSLGGIISSTTLNGGSFLVDPGTHTSDFDV